MSGLVLRRARLRLRFQIASLAATLFAAITVLLFTNYSAAAEQITLFLTELLQAWARAAFKKEQFEFDYAQYATLLSAAKIAALAAMAGFAAGLFVPLGGPRGAQDRHRRGAEIATAQQLGKLIKKELDRTQLREALQIANVTIPPQIENQHFLLVGTTGSGKSTALRSIVRQLRERGDSAIVVDLGGALLSEFYDDDDLIASPLDKRAKVWQLHREIKTQYDAAALAAALIPEHGSKEWSEYARALLSAILLSTDSLESALHAALVASQSELSKIIAHTHAAAMTADENSRMLASVRAILATHLAPLQMLIDDERGGFAMRDAVRVLDERSKFCWLAVTESQLAAMKQVVAAMIEMSVQELLSLSPSSQRRIWLIIDELPSFGKIPSLESFLTKARKFGGRAIIGIQSTAQLREVYSRDTAQTLLACLNNALVLRASDADTAEEMSKLLGEREIERELLSITESGREKLSQTRASNVRVERERVVMPAELQNLKTLAGYLRLASYPVAHVQIAHFAQRIVTDAMLEREQKRVQLTAQVKREQIEHARALAPRDREREHDTALSHDEMPF